MSVENDPNVGSASPVSEPAYVSVYRIAASSRPIPLRRSRDLEGHTEAAHPGWTATYELLRPYPNQRMRVVFRRVDG